MSEAAIALNRFGLGARPDQASPDDPRRWLTAQIDRYRPASAPIAAAPTSAAVSLDLVAYQAEQRNIRQTMGPRQSAQASAMASGANAAPVMADSPAPGPVQPQAMAPGRSPEMPLAMPAVRDARMAARQEARRAAQDRYVALVGARTNAALITDTPFAERLVHFWSNHFAVSADKLELVGLAGTLEMEAIRPHVMGRFADMLFAVERHPAMLLYLDQAVSVGPDSPLGIRIAGRGRRKVGLNENLAREIMELHTLGVRTGYTQADVTEFARAMTGWTVGGIGGGPGARLAGQATPGSFVFAAAIHQPGARTIVGKSYPEGGEAQAQAVLANLAVHPATAHHIATKLARHFAADTPPPAMVARLEQAFLSSGGDLPTVYRALIASPEAWTPAPAKFRTPWEWTIAAYRALGTSEVRPQTMLGLMNQLGQPVWKPGQPIGYDDTAPSWAGPDAIMRRVEAAERFAARSGATVDARALAPRLFPAAVSPATTQALSRAESPAQALALLLISPEMMRR
ncbi:uncharacterized protein (DUF1800 family) [Sphingomonas insulae]|uniref:DUF1800 family protein n=1 Tax=Sphingomonas insulae TaxID=424800 RepID=A0ABP3T4J4_9SPHN|nr:DUF1800 domain-containing protein [Sphingomonas insulae]NIJ28382.1 uncharacterized protein (DUF1800 family) [Sphingomonas insulae]